MRLINTDTLAAIACTVAIAFSFGAFARPPAKPEAPRPGKVVKDKPLKSMTAAELATRLAVLQAERQVLQKAAERDVRNRLHRIAYEKYRVIDSTISEDIRVLGEVKRREPDLRKRIRIGRRIDQVRHEAGEVRRMIELLRLYAKK